MTQKGRNHSKREITMLRFCSGYLFNCFISITLIRRIDNIFCLFFTDNSILFGKRMVFFF